MPAANIEISCSIEIPVLKGKVDSEIIILSPHEIEKFVSGELGDHYLKVLIPNGDRTYWELHANKLSMKKKGAVFEMTSTANGVNIAVHGIFKVTAYAHVLVEIKTNPSEIFISGLYCGKWPPYGGEFKGVDADKKKFPVLARLI